MKNIEIVTDHFDYSFSVKDYASLLLLVRTICYYDNVKEVKINGKVLPEKPWFKEALEVLWNTENE